MAPPGPGQPLPSPAPSTGQPWAVVLFSAGAVWAGLQSFSRQFTVNLPLSVQFPEQRSLGEVLGAKATHVTTAIIILPVRKLDPGGQQRKGRGVEGASFRPPHPPALNRAGSGAVGRLLGVTVEGRGGEEGILLGINE